MVRVIFWIFFFCIWGFVEIFSKYEKAPCISFFFLFFLFVWSFLIISISSDFGSTPSPHLWTFIYILLISLFLSLNLNFFIFVHTSFFFKRFTNLYTSSLWRNRNWQRSSPPLTLLRHNPHSHLHLCQCQRHQNPRPRNEPPAQRPPRCQSAAERATRKSSCYVLLSQ